MEGPRVSAQSSSRRTAPTAPGAKPRVPSIRLDDAELRPSDSASNAPTRKSASQSQKMTSPPFNPYERRTERTSITTKDTFRIRTRSPVKDAGANGTSRKNDIPRETPEPKRQGAKASGVQDLHKSKTPQRPWKPQASLIGHTSAPLASRISIPPLASTLPEALQPPPLAGLSVEAQESLILDDLLFAFMGFEGQYIRFVDSYNPSEEKERLTGPTFRILRGLDPSLKDLTSTMLDIAKHYIAVEAFIDVQSREEFGTINHALCASMRRLLKDYLVLIAQMENQLLTNDAFTLHVLHLHMLPTSNTLFQLYTLAQEILRKNKLLEEDTDSGDESDIDNLIEQLKDGGDLLGGKSKIQKGGNVLRLLTERLSHMSGDPAAAKILEGLLRDASRPYMDMLNEWLHRGSIRDPHTEFLIREQKSINRDKLEEDFTDAYWEKRYTVRENDVPPQLEAVKDKILLAGKYLNVVRECGGIDISKEVQDVPRTFDDPRFLTNISDAYAHANSSLLNLLLTTHELPARLRSMKHYFFLDRSDFFSAFLYLGNSELKKLAKDVNISKIQSLLDLVLRQPGSVAAQDPFKEDIKIHMNDQNLTRFLMSVVNVKGFEEGMEENLPRKTPSTKDDAEEAKKMTGYDALEFKFAVPFPLSLVISSKTVVRYQILFRYLLSLRHLEGQLLNSWEDHNKVISWTNKSGDRRLEMWKRRAWALRARMLNFVQSFMYYCTAEVIEPNWDSLMEKVNGKDKSGKTATRTVDELMEDHVDFLDTCLKECMLMNPKLLKIRDKLVSCCALFSTYTTHLSRTLCSADKSLVGTPAALEYLRTLYPSPRHPVPDTYKSYDPEALKKMTENLDRYETNFNRHIKILLDALDYYAATETVALSRLCAQLSMASEKGGEGKIPL